MFFFYLFILDTVLSIDKYTASNHYRILNTKQTSMVPVFYTRLNTERKAYSIIHHRYAILHHQPIRFHPKLPTSTSLIVHHDQTALLPTTLKNRYYQQQSRKNSNPNERLQAMDYHSDHFLDHHKDGGH